MLAEERFSKILSIIEEAGSVTVQDLMEELGASESTIRRDLNTMDANGLLVKVFGGAVAKNTNIRTQDENVDNRKLQNIEEKVAIAKYAASLIQSGDFVYIDAGTSTELVIDYIKVANVTFVTNSLTHAKKLSNKGYTVYILGGEFKSTTEAIVGEEAVETLDKYNFTKGFWGTNAVSLTKGFSTPEPKEALVKKRSMENCRKCYILADASKFNKISNVTFAGFESADILTTDLTAGVYLEKANVINL